MRGSARSSRVDPKSYDAAIIFQPYFNNIIMIIPTGTLINVLAVIAGSLIGLSFRNILKDKYKQIVFQSLGLITIVLGISMAIDMRNPLIVIFSILIGGILGEFIRLEDKFDSIAVTIKTKLKLEDSKFTEGLISAFLLFCVGSMTILGAVNEGTSGDNSLLITKSVLDFFSSIALASTFGVGVLFSAIPMLIFQGGLTILASYLGSFFSTELISYLSAVGGLLITAIGINLLELKRIKTANLLPALLVVVVIFVVLRLLGVDL